MRVRHRRSRAVPVAVAGALIATLAAAGGARAAGDGQDAKQPRADGNSSMVMVLDSSGSMADDDGSGASRIASARKAIGTVVDALPEDYPTGLRVYGADKPKGCTDTRLVKPVEPLDRDGIKQAVADVKPKGDTPIGYSLQKAAADLPKPANGALGRRTILLISDGEDNCGAPKPCDVAKQLGAQGVDLRIDAIGFQVRGKARKALECIADAGHGEYYDAPDAAALARQLQRAGRLSAEGYRMKGKQITGGLKAADAEAIEPGQYLDTIGPGETRYYRADLDDASTADFGVTAVPPTGVKVAYSDGIDLKLTATDEYSTQCMANRAHFDQEEGAVTLTNAVNRIPSHDGDDACDKAGTYLLAVSRTSAATSDQARWPLELVYGLEKPLKKGTVPAQAETEYGDVKLPTSAPKDVAGGTGFNDATPIGTGVWRDRLLPAQSRFYRVQVGWGQQVRYRVEFANEPKTGTDTSVSTFAATSLYAPDRTYIDPSDFNHHRTYYGKPTSADNGSVPVAWTNRWTNESQAYPVRRNGTYYIEVKLGPNAAQFARNTAIGVVLRVDVAGKAKTGPQHNAPPVQADSHGTAAKAADDSGGGPSTGLIAGIAGAAVLVIAGATLAIVRTRRRRAGVGGSGVGGSGIGGSGVGGNGVGGGPAAW